MTFPQVYADCRTGALKSSYVKIMVRIQNTTPIWKNGGGDSTPLGHRGRRRPLSTDWLKGLDQALKEFPNIMNCHRAHRIVLNGEGLETYNGSRPVN